jgi:hypothetical protein
MNFQCCLPMTGLMPRRIRPQASFWSVLPTRETIRCCVASEQARQAVKRFWRGSNVATALRSILQKKRCWYLPKRRIAKAGAFGCRECLHLTGKKLCALVPTTSNTSLLSAELSAHLELLFGQHLLQIRDADWIESLSISVVDDWVVQNDLMTANLLSVAGQSMGSFRSSGKPAICTALSATTFGALDSELANFNDQRFWEQALKAVDARVEFEHAILTAAQKHSLLR